MKQIIFAAVVVSVGMLLVTNGARAGEIKEGQWSMTTVVHMQGGQSAEAAREMENMSPEDKAMMDKMMGGMGMKMGASGGGMGMSTTRMQCITTDNPVPEASNEDNCHETHTSKGNTVNFEVVCDKSRSTGQVTYKNDSMQGTIQSTQTNGEKVAIDINGKYVGPCPGENTSLNRNHSSVQGTSEQELAMKQKELDLKARELELKQKELDLASAANKGNTKPTTQSKIDDVNNAVNTTNNVKNIFGGVGGLFGR